MAEVKNNMATRFADEIQGGFVGRINLLRENARVKNDEARVFNAQADTLENEMRILKNKLAQGNYEKVNGKDA